MINHDHILDVEQLLKTMRVLGSESLQVELARIIRREMLEYIPRRKGFKFELPVHPHANFERFRQDIIDFNNFLNAAKKDNKSPDLFRDGNKLSLIRALRTMRDDVNRPHGSQCRIGLFEAKYIIEQVFADWIK